MKKKEILKTIKRYVKTNKNNKINITIQNIYNKYGYGYSEISDDELLMELQNYNMIQKDPYFATGQNGYFHEQIKKYGLGHLKLDVQDIEDAKYISNCFGKETMYSENNIPIFYATILGSTEFNYGTQTFPAGIFEDVFQCDADHELPIQPIVGESEQDYYLRVLMWQIESFESFDIKNKNEVLNRGKRLIDNFCRHKNKIYLIKFSDIKDIKASFGDVSGLRDGNASFDKSKQIIQNLPSFTQLLTIFSIDSYTIYIDQNMKSEYGISFYDIIPYDKIQYIEIERKYDMIQKRAIDYGYNIGDVIPSSFEKTKSNI